MGYPSKLNIRFLVMYMVLTSRNVYIILIYSQSLNVVFTEINQYQTNTNI